MEMDLDVKEHELEIKIMLDTKELMIKKKNNKLLENVFFCLVWYSWMKCYWYHTSARMTNFLLWLILSMKELT